MTPIELPLICMQYVQGSKRSLPASWAWFIVLRICVTCVSIWNHCIERGSTQQNWPRVYPQRIPFVCKWSNRNKKSLTVPLLSVTVTIQTVDLSIIIFFLKVEIASYINVISNAYKIFIGFLKKYFCNCASLRFRIYFRLRTEVVAVTKQWWCLQIQSVIDFFKCSVLWPRYIVFVSMCMYATLY